MKHEQIVHTLAENVRIFSERIEGSELQRDVCLRQWMAHTVQQNVTADPEALYHAFSGESDALRPKDRAMFCLYLSRHTDPKAATALHSVLPMAEQAAPGSHGKVALVRNRLNEEALRIFSQSITAAKPSYLPSFADTCEDVFDNRCEFGILPIENTADGRLFGFYNMLDRYELRICATCQLETEHTVGSVRYALVGKNPPTRIPKHSQWLLECAIVTEIGEFPKDIFEVLPTFGASLVKIDSLPVPYDDGLHKIYFTIQIPKETANAFHFYLTMEHSRYSLIGFYPNLNV